MTSIYQEPEAIPVCFHILFLSFQMMQETSTEIAGPSLLHRALRARFKPTWTCSPEAKHSSLAGRAAKYYFSRTDLCQCILCEYTNYHKQSISTATASTFQKSTFKRKIGSTRWIYCSFHMHSKSTMQTQLLHPFAVLSCQSSHIILFCTVYWHRKDKTNISNDQPSSCFWTLLSSFRIELIS